MPHTTVELSQGVNIDETELLSKLNHALFATGQFKESRDIKGRIHRSDASLIGLGAEDGGHFVIAHLAIMQGRTDEIKSDLVSVVMKVLQQVVSPKLTGVQYAVNLTELSHFYQKALV